MPNLAAFLSYVFVVSFTPGPNTILCMATASKFGFKKTLRLSLGIATGFFMVFLISVYFNIALFHIMPKIKAYVSLIGAAYMLYLAFKIFKSRPPKQVQGGQGEFDSSDAGNLYLTGLTMQFFNPKGIIYNITVASTFVIPNYTSNLAYFAFALLLTCVAFTSTAVWASFGAMFSRFLHNYYKPFNLIMSLLLVYSALSILGIVHF